MSDSNVKIVSWSSGTDEEVAAMIDAAQQGKINLQTDGHWAVGDVRTVHIDGYNYQDGHRGDDDYQIVISSFADYNNCGCVMQIDFKQWEYTQKMNTTKTYSDGYRGSSLRTVVIPSLYNAFPTWLKSRLTSFDLYVLKEPWSDEIVTITNNKLALRSQTEIFGPNGYEEDGEGSCIDLYKDPEQRYKNPGVSLQYFWWIRTPSSTIDKPKAIKDINDGTMYAVDADELHGLVVFGCVKGNSVNDYKVTRKELTDVANSIRTKANTGNLLVWPDGYISAVNSIVVGDGRCPRSEQLSTFLMSDFNEKYVYASDIEDITE